MTGMSIKALSAEEIREHVNAIQRIMQAVMREGVHYGIVPGAQKPTLYKPGAEVLCRAFGISASFSVEDLSALDCYRYRVKCTGTHQQTGTMLGEGLGTCSSNEERYKWRRAVSNEEWDATPEARRRIKHTSRGKIRQVRAEADDIENTVLKMASKRAYIAMTLTATAASDIFGQDLEDLPEHLRESEATQQEVRSRQEPRLQQEYSAEQFALNLPKWRDIVASGKKTPEQIVALLSARVHLSNAQRDAILALGDDVGSADTKSLRDAVREDSDAEVNAHA